ncbi:eukaryotic translation initiation factor 3 62 kDa subunit [Coprinopsis cinerea okayama7|uniref:tRNA (adenine(58)-N(1))-methyltransferase non-catalytic subunit TRM6 n=1 Tax=Coprinopsis cinerea (strain Okayama-7 / 130 / ATCC MYA-4618 / FGSC 9003) TaxID=240176 RepID=A8N2Y8_COPC7|nr:eukaryotic translation initiation factor 3 62 kDa subunit [Coprinopsis cinerea okayama7\|eukprot:XP_001829223.2 eukaryotic translation initiation factor 3 62 kDa subunit [Coprinopsis cinerea okayama7\
MTETSPRPTIQHGNTILVRLPNNDLRSVKVEKNTLRFYHQKLGRKLVCEVGRRSSPSAEALPPEDTDATNELINDGEFVQPLTVEEIKALKQSGAHSSDIIQKQIENHANFNLKTEYSKEKYLKRKEAKYSKCFTTVEPTLFNVCEYWFEKDQFRIRDIRMDTLSQILNLANVRPGGRYLVVDDASGLIAAGVLTRLGGEGRLLAICDTESPPAFPVFTQMNFDQNVTKPLASLNWATSQKDYTPIVPPSELPSEEIRSERQKSRLKKRKAINDLLNNTREDLFAGEFNSLIIASEYDPMVIIERLYPYLAGSASIVVHSPYVQVVADLQAKLRNQPQYLFPSVTEGWLRRYQVI